MKSQLAYKLSIDIVKNLTKNQDNIKRDIRYGEYSKLLSLSYEFVDAISEDSSQRFIILGRIKNRLQILTEMKFIKISFSTIIVKIINKIKTELLSHDDTE